MIGDSGAQHASVHCSGSFRIYCHGGQYLRTDGPSTNSRALDPVNVAATSHEIDAKAGWAYSVEVAAVVASTQSEPAVESAVCHPVFPPAAVTVECVASNQVVVKWAPASGADHYSVSVAGHPQAPGRPTTVGRTVPHSDLPAGQQLSLTVPGKLGWDYTATVTAVNTVSSFNLESAPVSSTGQARCTGIEIQCQADGQLKIAWARNNNATRYRIRINATTTTDHVVSLDDVLIPQPAQTTRTISHYIDAEANNRYDIRIAAQVDGTWTTDPAPETVTCQATIPPKPTGVTATCSDGQLTVNWEPTGEGLAKATTYKPRIFTGEPPTESPNWTTNTPSPSTTATIPAPNEPTLPNTGTFQIRVKATNTAGNSNWSDPIETTCGPPGPITGLQCIAITKDKITIEWDPAVGADTYSVTGRRGHGRGAHIVYGDLGNGGRTTNTISDLKNDAIYTITAVAYNAEGTSDARVSCRTLDKNWLAFECSGSGVLSVRWDDPSGSLPTPSGFVGIINLVSPILDGLVASYDESYDSIDSTVEWGAIGASEAEYQVYVKSSNANGGPIYSQVQTITCPALSPPTYFSPNLPKELSLFEKILGEVGLALVSRNTAFSSIEQRELFFGGTHYAIHQADENCSTTRDDVTGITTKTCGEIWNEYVTVRLDEHSCDEVLGDLANTYIPDEEIRIAWSLTRGAYDLRRVWKELKKFGNKKAAVRFTGRQLRRNGLVTYTFVIYRQASAPYAEISGLGNCTFEYPEDRGDDIKSWAPIAVTAHSTEAVGSVQVIRNSVVHFCQEVG